VDYIRKGRCSKKPSISFYANLKLFREVQFPMIETPSLKFSYLQKCDTRLLNLQLNPHKQKVDTVTEL
jgi:hypothetical protein